MSMTKTTYSKELKLLKLKNNKDARQSWTDLMKKLPSNCESEFGVGKVSGARGRYVFSHMWVFGNIEILKIAPQPLTF